MLSIEHAGMISLPRRLMALLLAAVGLDAGCWLAGEPARPFPPDLAPWPRRAAEGLGWSSEKLTTARDSLRTDLGAPFVVFDAIVVAGGYDIFHYGNPYERRQGWGAQNDWASCGRSLMTTMYGMVFHEKGEATAALELPAHAFFGPVTRTGMEMDRRVLVKHLLGYASCGDTPGMEWEYGCRYFDLYRILRDHDGSPPRYRLERLARAIGADWEPFEYWGHRQDVPFLTISSSVAHAARWGYLWLNRGSWNGDQIVDPAFVEASVRPVRRSDGSGWVHPNEGLQIHLNAGGMWGDLVPRDAYAAFGHGGRVIFVCPSLDLVVAIASEPAAYRKNEVDGMVLRDIRNMMEPILAAHDAGGGRASGGID